MTDVFDLIEGRTVYRCFQPECVTCATDRRRDHSRPPCTVKTHFVNGCRVFTLKLDSGRYIAKMDTISRRFITDGQSEEDAINEMKTTIERFNNAKDV